jgi:hypothetical protein
MLVCPHCMYPLTGRQTPATNGGSQHTVWCSNCEAILRVEVTTLKDPNPERVKKKEEKK